MSEKKGIDNKGMTWVHHKSEKSKIVTDEDAKKLYGEGWATSPAKFLKAGKSAKTEEVKTVEKMTKDELLAHAKNVYSADLVDNQSKAKILEEVQMLELEAEDNA